MNSYALNDESILRVGKKYLGAVMDFLDSLNLYLMQHPVMLTQLEYVFRIKFWVLLGLAIYFLLLPYRQRRKDLARQAELAKTKKDRFLA